MRQGPKPAKAKVEAKPPAARKLRNSPRVRDLETSLAEALKREAEAQRREAEALEQQTATAEILRVISRSSTDVQPVFDGIIANAVRLCGAVYGIVWRFEGDVTDFVSTHNVQAEELEELRRRFPRRTDVDAEHIHTLVRSGTVLTVPDIETYGHVTPEQRARWRTRGVRSLLVVPMRRDHEVIGAIGVSHRDVDAFQAGRVQLLKTFADQAVIAIENVRLFKELEARNRDLTEALEQQTATAEILRVISASPTDVQPVFETIAERAMRLCEATVSNVFRFDGTLIHLAAMTNRDPNAVSAVGEVYPMSPGRTSGAARAVLTKEVVQIPDVLADPDYRIAHAAGVAGFRSVLSVPMLRDGVPLGAINVGKADPGPFTAEQVALLQTFADQAVIAIENVRLFTELKEKNQALTEAHAQVTESLEQQTATAEVLKVISRSTFDLEPILETLIENATRLCGATRGHIFRLDGDVLRYAASYGATAEFVDWLERNPIRPGPGSVAGRAASQRRTVHVRDVLAESGYEPLGLQRLQDYRTVLAVPMLRGDALLGVITILNTRPVPFTQTRIDLVTTFADQAVIAIENVRLLQELQSRTAELGRSVEELRVLGEVGQAVNSTLDLETVLNTIATRAVQLSGANGGVIYEYDEATQVFNRIRGGHDLDDDFRGVLAANPLRLGEGAAGKAVARQAPVQVADVLARGSYDVERIHAIFERRGYRSLLAVPLLFERQIVGCLVVWGREPGGFPQKSVDLLQALATQSVLAIQNARLFREIEDKSRQLEVASQHKSEFLANMSHELRTPLNAIIGFSEVLTERMFGDLNEKQEEYSKDIHASGQHLLSLINDILDLSKIEAGRMELELTDFDLPTALDNALTLVRERAGRRSIALQMSVDVQLGEIRADERKVRQVVLNLLSNAIKFTPEGGRIEVAAVSRDGLAEVSVTDTGVGIAPEDQEAVFEEFRQVGTAEKKAEGTGLGLALSRKFIELHSGRIWVKSQVGHGSTFTFTLPVRREPSDRGGTVPTLNS
jgi:two-component system, NtrC family, sensor kinase